MIWTLVALAGMGAAHAQYFGRNKVTYEEFDFRTLRSEHFHVYYYPPESTAVDDAARMLERWHRRLKNVFRAELVDTQPVILYANHPDFQQTNIVSELIGQGTGGFTEGFANRIVIPLTGAYAANDHVLGHELVHAFQYSIIKSRQLGLRSAQRMPLWFVEGMAEYLARGSRAPGTTMWLRDALLHDDLPDIKRISRDMHYFPYRYGHALWAYVGGRWGDDVVELLYLAVLARGLDGGVEKALGMSLDSLSSEWQKAVKGAFAPAVAQRTPPDSLGRLVPAEAAEMSLAPALSPDGRRIAYLSRAQLFSIDLYIADAGTGEVVRKLATSNTDAGYDDLQFMNAAGSWSPDGRRLAFVVVRNGDNAIALFDTRTGDMTRVIQIDSVDAIMHVAWSPDGSSILLSGTRGGISDLYVYRLGSGALVQLTHDKHADLHPAWSPDGATIAFVSDRGSTTDFHNLCHSTMHLALLDTENGDIRIAAIHPRATHLSPQFSPDGKDIYLVADPDGVRDVYRYAREENRFYRLTEVATGVSGLGKYSPVLSVARDSLVLAVNVFNNREYNVRVLTGNPQGRPLTPSSPALCLLPPTDTERLVDTYLADPAGAAIPDSALRRQLYDPKMGLVHVGQTGVGVSLGPQGAGVGGGATLVFGDIMGDHTFGTSLIANGGIKDIGGQVFYGNRARRLDWAAAVGHTTNLWSNARVTPDTVTIDSEKVAADRWQLVLERYFVENVQAVGHYPLSTNRRIECAAGYSHVWPQFEGREALVHERKVIGERSFDPEEPSALDLFSSALALVGDYSYFGHTGPASGRRYRLEVAPTVGSLNYLTALCDYRHYAFLRPLTVALRFLHIGRYFGDSESGRLAPFSLGYPAWVRGYHPLSFGAGECEGADKCPSYERLFGSRIALAGVELRLPVVGTQELGLLAFRYLPTSLVVFGDGGVAWRKDELPELEIRRNSTERIPVFSAGGGLRLNLLGALIGEVYYAYAFQRPGRPHQFGFVLAPGW